MPHIRGANGLPRRHVVVHFPDRAERLASQWAELSALVGSEDARLAGELSLSGRYCQFREKPAMSWRVRKYLGTMRRGA